MRQQMLRVLLCLLAAARGRVVSADALIDGLWGSDGSRERERNLHSQVSALRRRLEEVEPGRGRSRLEHAGGGYRLALGDATVDAEQFEELARRGREKARAGDAAEAAELLRAALGLWRGPALSDAAPWCSQLAAEAARLEELRAGVIEDLADCDLALGRHADVAGELAARASELPIRERLSGQLMVALYRAGRRGEALAVFDRTRRVLAEELGLDPGPHLRELHAQVLADDPALAPPVAPGTHPERLVQLAPEAASARPDPEPPQRVPVGGRHLPAPGASFIGRAAELAELGKLVERHRLVTVVGPGGVGKTRLAIEVASGQLGRHRDGVWFVDLAEVSDPARLPGAVADAVGIRSASERPVAELVIERVAGMQALLVLDNCEHLVDPVAPLTEQMLEAGPGVRVLATSRQPLGLPGEMVWPAPPVAFPRGDDLRDPAGLACFDAVRLFLERAPGLPDGDASSAELRLIAEITASLEGLPLAIELAAARLAQLNLDELAAALKDRLGLSFLRSRSAHARQRTLDATIGWSYELLAPHLRSVLKRLSVFSGGFTLEAAAAVTGSAASSTEMVVLLAERSLITLDRSPLAAGGISQPAARYRMLESIRQYCAGRISAEDRPEEHAATCEAHSQYFTELAHRASTGLAGWQQARWLTTLESDHANLTATLDYLLAIPGRGADALQMIVNLDRFWHNRGHLAECDAFLARALAAVGQQASGSLRSAALSLRGQVAIKNDNALARSFFNEALTVADRTGDDAAAATALWGLSWTESRLGDTASALARGRSAVERARACGDLIRLGESLLCLCDRDLSSDESTAAAFNELISVTDRTGDRIYAALGHNNFGNYKLTEGDLAAALEHFEYAQAILAEIGAPSPWPLLNIGWIRIRSGTIEAANAALTEALQMPGVQHLRRETGYLALALACSAVAARELIRAACLLGFADSELRACGQHWPEPERTYRDEALAISRQELGAGFQSTYELARVVDRGELVEFALRRRQLPQLFQPVSQARLEEQGRSLPT